MRLLEPFAFIDASGARWEAPVGSIVDGASIPQIAWTLIGGPFEGRYREASVIHDVACVVRNKPWQQVHKAFYHAMLANGVDIKKAEIMYAAVYHFGPRWGRSMERRVLSSDRHVQMDAYKIRTLKGDKVEITSRPGSLPRTVYVKAIYVPKPSALPESKFDQLAREIESRDMSLEEIENFTGASQ